MGCYFKSKRTEKKNFQPTQPSQLPGRAELPLNTSGSNATFLPEVRGLWKALCQFLLARQMFRIQWAHRFPHSGSRLPQFTTQLLCSFLLPPATLAPDSVKQSCGETTSLSLLDSLLHLFSPPWTPFSVRSSKFSDHTLECSFSC